MNFEEKVTQLSQIIDERLLPLIRQSRSNECIYLELPYYRNIGDILIWHGTEYFLKRAGLKCLYKASLSTYSEQAMKKITRLGETTSSKKIMVFLQGGGNFGDLWEGAQEFRKKIIAGHPDSQIVILPQTVFYNDVNKMKYDADLFAGHKNLTICARDKKSYQILKENFSNNIILVPDMAFCTPCSTLKKLQIKQRDKTLFLKRKDKEINSTIDYTNLIPEKKFEVRDWPSMEKMTINIFVMKSLVWASRRNPFLFSKLTDTYVTLFFKPNMVKIGVRFLSRYNKIYTTRLHVAILCCLLGKPYIFFDNSYGKNSSFFEAWLNDLDEVEFHYPSNE